MNNVKENVIGNALSDFPQSGQCRYWWTVCPTYALDCSYRTTNKRETLIIFYFKMCYLI